jgi:hypothetical protein
MQPYRSEVRHKLGNDLNWEMEDDLNLLETGRQPQSFGKWKTTTILRKWGQPQSFENGR